MSSVKVTRIILVLIIVSLGALVYSFNLHKPFDPMDDQVSIVGNETIKDLNNIPKVFFQSFFGAGQYYRPLTTLSFMVNHSFAGLNPFYYNLTNILLHLTSCVLVFFLIQTLFKRDQLSYTVSLLFAVHPVHWEAICNVAGRSILLCTLWYLMAFLFFVLHQNQKEKKIYLVISVVSFFLSLLSKESGVTLVLIFLSYHYFVIARQSFGDFKKNLRYQMLPFWIVLLIYILIRQFGDMKSIQMWDSIPALLLGVGTFLRGVLDYARLILFPFDLHFDRALPLFKSFANVHLLFLYCLFIGLFVIIFKKRKKIEPLVCFFISWIMITLLPVAQLIPIRSQFGYAAVSEHFLYLPSIGIFAVLGCAIFELLERIEYKGRDVRVAVLAFLALWGVVLIATTMQQAVKSSREFGIFLQALKHEPHNLRLRHGLALGYALKQDYDRAQFHYEQVLKREPGNVGARISYGRVLYEQGQYFPALKEYGKLRDLDVGPFTDILKSNREVALKKLKQERAKNREKRNP